MMKNKIKKMAIVASAFMLLSIPMSFASEVVESNFDDVQPMVSQITNKINFNKVNVFKGETLTYTAEVEFGNFAMTNPFTSCMDIAINYNVFEKPSIGSNNTGQTVSYSYLSSDSKINAPSWSWQSGTKWFYVPKTWTVSGTAKVRSNSVASGSSFVGQKDKTWNSSGYDAFATVYVK